MAEKIIMPKQGLQMTEGTITEWLRPEGAAIKKGEPLFEMETDKLTITIDSPVDGILLKIIAPEGTTVPITNTIAIAGSPGEDISFIDTGSASPGAGGPFIEAGSAVSVPHPPGAESSVSSTAVSPADAAPQRVFISPRAKTLAEELAIDYSVISGGAPDGMIIERDIIAAQTAARAAARPAARAVMQTDENLAARPTVMAIADTASAHSAAQAVHRISVRMDEAVKLRSESNKKISYTGLITYATVRALADFPAVNAEFTTEGARLRNYLNLGVAVAPDGGLAAPVIKDARKYTMASLSAHITELAAKARGNEVLPDDFAGSCFTVSNLGMYGPDESIAVVLPPESGVLAAGRITDTPVAIDGAVAVKPVMKLALSYDNRAVGGATAAKFLARIKAYLECPYLML